MLLQRFRVNASPLKQSNHLVNAESLELFVALKDVDALEQFVSLGQSGARPARLQKEPQFCECTRVVLLRLLVVSEDLVYASRYLRREVRHVFLHHLQFYETIRDSLQVEFLAASHPVALLSADLDGLDLSLDLALDHLDGRVDSHLREVRDVVLDGLEVDEVDSEAFVVGLAHALPERAHHLLAVAHDLQQLALHEFGGRRVDLRDLVLARGQLLAVLEDEDQVAQVSLEALVELDSVHLVARGRVVDEGVPLDSRLKAPH